MSTVYQFAQTMGRARAHRDGHTLKRHT